MAEVLFLDLNRSGTSLGIDVETGRQSAGWDGVTLLIKRVKDDGAIHAWCQQQRRLIQPGDRILAANGCRGDATRILAECQKPQLRLEIQAHGAWRSRRPSLEHVEEICHALRSSSSAAEAVELLRRHRGHWHPAWGALCLLRIAVRSTAKTRQAWAKDAAVLELAEWQVAEVKLAQDLPALELALMSLEGLRLLGLPMSVELVAQVAKRLVTQGSALSTKSLCRLLWLSAPVRTSTTTDGLVAAEGVAGPLRVLRQRPATDFDGIDLRMIVDASRRWSESTWLQGLQRLLPGRILAKQVLAEECIISFSLTIHERLEGWSVLFSSEDDRFPALYVSKEGHLGLRTAATKESLKDVLEEQKQSEPPLQVQQLALISLRFGESTWALSVDGRQLLELSKPPHRGDGAVTLLCSDTLGTKVAQASVGHMVHRPLRSCPGKDVPLLQKLLPRLRSSDAEGSASLFPSSEVPAVELVRLAEDLAHLELWNDEEGLKSLGREILRRRPELKVEELQLAKGAFAMLHLNLQDVWSTVGARMTTRGGSTITQQKLSKLSR